MTNSWQSKDFVARYDRTASILIQRRDEMLATIVDQLPFPTDQAVRIVDVGAGFGAIIATVFRRFPDAQIAWIDVSEEMRHEATRRLAAYEGSITYRLRDFNAPHWSKDLGGPFDAVVSSLALHHTTDTRRVYADVYRLLKPGGYFVNGDMVRAPEDWL